MRKHKCGCAANSNVDSSAGSSGSSSRQNKRCRQTNCDVCSKNPKPNDLVFDYVIVGLGTAGAPLARYLSEDMTTSVLVLEAGEDRSADPLVLQGGPAGSSDLTADPRYSFIRSEQLQDSIATNTEIFARTSGRMWGGSSGHNRLLAVRSPDVYNEWALVDPQWAYNSLLPIMKFMETYTPNGTVFDPVQRGATGPLFITQTAPPIPPAEPLAAAVTAATTSPVIPDYNDPAYGDVGISANQIYATPVTNQRSWSQSAFTPNGPIVTPTPTGGIGTGNRKLQILSKATVGDLVIDNGDSGLVAQGARFFLADSPDVVRVARARKKIILCAGTDVNPAILQRSGIGPTSVLSGLGIPVKLANENVGRNGQNHFRVFGLIPRDGKPLPPGLHTYNDGSGVNIAQPNDHVRRMQMVFSNGNSNIPVNVLTALGIQNVPAVQSQPLIFTVNRLGTVEIISTDPNADPLVTEGLFRDTTGYTELHRAVDAYKILANISLAYTGLMPLYPPAFHYPAPYPGGTAPDDSLLQSDALAAQGSTRIQSHETGTCRMATGPDTGVVDKNLDVFGVAKLACCDNSVVPAVAKGNAAYQPYVLGIKKAQLEGAIIPGL